MLAFHVLKISKIHGNIMIVDMGIFTLVILSAV